MGKQIENRDIPQHETRCHSGQRVNNTNLLNLGPDRPELRKIVNRRRITSHKPIKYKDIKITNKMKVTKTHQSTNVVSKQFHPRQYREQVCVQDFPPATFELERINALFGDAFND